MTNNISFEKASPRLMVGVGLFAAALAFLVLSVPVLSYAATFAYVSQTGEVRTVVADTPYSAMAIAPNIDEHSGVLLLDSPDDNAVVGDYVPGV